MYAAGGACSKARMQARIRVALDPARGGFVADGALLPGAHAAVGRLVAAPRAPASARNSIHGMAGKDVGARVHAQLERFYAGGGAADEHPLAAGLRAALAPHVRGAATLPELAVAAPALGFATSVDLVAHAGGRALVVEYKTGYLATFDTASAGRWRAAVAPAMAAARIDCTPGGRAAAQAFLGALALAATYGVPLEHVTVVVARAWAVGARVCTALRAFPLAAPAHRAVADALARCLARHTRDGRRARGAPQERAGRGAARGAGRGRGRRAGPARGGRGAGGVRQLRAARGALEPRR